jgi:hypothetical protein
MYILYFNQSIIYSLSPSSPVLSVNFIILSSYTAAMCFNFFNYQAD